MVGFFRKKQKNKAPKSNTSSSNSNADYFQDQVLSQSIDDNISRLKAAMNNNFDIITRKFRINSKERYAAVLYIESLVKEEFINEYIIKPLTQTVIFNDGNKAETVDFKTIKDYLIKTGDNEEAHSFDKVVLGVLSGSTLLLVEGSDKGILVSTRQYVGRNSGVPVNEPSVKGPKENFVENLKDNIGLLRKRFKDPNLVMENYKIGKRSKSDVIIIYIKDIAHKDIVAEVRNRIKKVEIDDSLATSKLAQYITDRPNSIFPLIQITERPDTVIASIEEGRIAITMEASPGVLIVPCTLPMLMQSADDYYENWIIGSVLRFGRYVALFISALFPALYVAITSFNPGILPTGIVLSITGARMGVPFPAFVEAFLMTATLELLVEASLRLPKIVGQTVSIVGGLVIGQAAVQAGVISPIMLIVISLTAMSSFVIPDYSLGLATRILRIPFMIAAFILGPVGTSFLLLSLLGYTCSLESFGVGYLEPITPYSYIDGKDTLIRLPQRIFYKRPKFLWAEDTKRLNNKRNGGQGESKK